MLTINPASTRAAADQDVATRRLAGVNVADLTTQAAVSLLAARLDARVFTRLAFLNAHCVNFSRSSDDYRGSLGHFIVLPDGVGVDIAARMLYGAAFKANLNGTDFVPYLLSRLAPKRVALLGAAPGVAEAAAAGFASLVPHHSFLPITDGFFADGEETRAVLRRLRQAEADIVLIALGVPAQELFITRHLGPEHAHLAIGVGALLDFMAGRIPRAPAAVRALRAEWLWRLGVEPRRMFARYVLGNPRFLAGVLKDRLTR